mgnify:CR=1 FL=1
MAVIVVSNVFAMLCTILGYFKAAGWSLGIVEAVSALVLLGSSVDYSLHVAEAFVDCSQHNRVSANPMGRSALQHGGALMVRGARATPLWRYEIYRF